MVLPSKVAKINSEDFRKCGEISTAIKLGKNVYAFHCTFCATETCLPFLSFNNFVLHLEVHHSHDFDDGLALEEENDELLLEEEKDYVLEIDKNGLFPAEESDGDEVEENKFSDMIKETNKAASQLTDPLDVRPLEVVAAELPDTVDVKIKDELVFSDNEENSMNDNINYVNDTNNSDSSETVYSSVANPLGGNEIEKDASEIKITLAIIACYEEQRLLWDENDPNSKNRKKRKQAFQKISDCLYQKIGLRLKVEDIHQRIKRMRYKFRSQKLANSRNGNNTSVWYYDKLAFLNLDIKCKQPSKKALVKEQSTLPLSGLTNEQNIELIEIYKNIPCMWDVQHLGFRFQNQQQEALDEMLETVRTKMNLEFTVDEMQEIINCIRNTYLQEKDLKLQCERVKEEFIPKNKYYENICFLEPYVGPFQCEFCEKVFNSVDQYKLHKFQHDGSMPFTCPLCSHGFKDSGNYKVHLRRHTRDYPYECEVCGKRYATTTDVKGHMRHHTGEKPYFCEICGRSFRAPSLFRNHMRRHENKPPSHQCTICKKSFHERSRLNEHMKIHLNLRDKVCNICGKAFTTKKTLRQHKQIHEEKKRYDCKICGREFAQYAGISGHMKSHGTTLTGVLTEECR